MMENKFILYFILCFISFLVLFFSLSIETFSQDLFISKYHLDKQSIASIAILIYRSPTFDLGNSIKIFIQNNIKKFEELESIYQKSTDSEDTLGINIETYNSSSALLKFKQIKDSISNNKLDQYTFFLTDFANLLFFKDSLTDSLEKLFKENAEETIEFSKVQVRLTTDENLFLHIKDPKKSIDHYIVFEKDNLNDSIFDLLYFVFKERIFYTTILPKKVELSKDEQQNFINLTGKPFIYPEVENMLESLFTIYCISDQKDKIYSYTGLSILDKLNSISFYYKNSWINHLIKLWDSTNNESFFKFPKPYGLMFLNLISKSTSNKYDEPFGKIIELNSDLTCVIDIPAELKFSSKKINLIEKKLKKIGFKNVISKEDYLKNIDKLTKEKIIFVYLSTKDNVDNSNFNISLKDNNIQLNQMLIKSFTEISYISYFDRIEILLLIKNSSIDYIMRAISLIPKIKNEPIINNRNFFKRLIDKIISIISPLSL